MTSASPEKVIVENPFGTVTSKRVTYAAKKSWFSGGHREDVPLKQVVSIRQETNRNVFMGLFLIILGLVLLAAIIGIIPLFFGVILLWGSPVINVVTAGGTSSPVVGWPWQSQQADEFVNAVRNQLFVD